MKIFRFLVVLLACLVALPCLSNPMDDTQLSCLLEPSREIDLSSAVEGVVSHVNAERGDTVREGAIVLTLESAAERASLEIAQEREAFSTRTVERNEELLRQKLLSGAERDELLTEMRLAGLSVKEVQARLEQKTIRSPITGVVAKRYISIGEYVGSDPVMKLVALDPLHAEIVMRSDYYGQIKRGMKVSVEVQGLSRSDMGGQRYEGTVLIVDRVIDGASTTFGVRVSIPNPEFRLPSGLKCRVFFNEADTAG